MANTQRVDKKLFDEEHYLGKPADARDRIIARRIDVLGRYPEFFGKSFNCIEVGCGSGATITRLAKRFKSSLGVDIFNYAAAFNSQREHNGAPDCRFRQLDLEKELPEEKFDRLISFEVIEHLRSEESVKSYFDVLKDGGMAAVSVPNKWWVFETHGASLPLLPWNRVPFFSWLPTVIHERFANARIYTRARIEKLLARHGFTVIDVQYITAPMDVLKEGRLKKIFTKYIFRNDTTRVPLLSTSIFVLAQKKASHE